MRAPPRRKATLHTSWMTAPPALVTTPTMRGSLGKARLRAAAKSPSAASFSFSFASASSSAPLPDCSARSAMNCIRPRGAQNEGLPRSRSRAPSTTSAPRARRDVRLVHGDVDRRLLVLVAQAEVQMSTRGRTRAGDLAFDPDRLGERAVERALDGPPELGDGEREPWRRARRRLPAAGAGDGSGAAGAAPRPARARPQPREAAPPPAETAAAARPAPRSRSSEFAPPRSDP